MDSGFATTRRPGMTSGYDSYLEIIGLGVAIEPLAHFLAGLEERHALLVDRHMRPGARIAPGARRPVLDRKGPETTQLDAITARQRGDDLAQDGVDDVLNVTLIKVRI